MTGFAEYEDYDGLGLAELARDGEVTAEEILSAAVERMEARNPKLNAVVRPMIDEAQNTVAASVPDGPFAGVPFLLKDLGVFYAGVPTTSGSRLFADFIPDHDSTLVERFRAAGLVIMGKTNTPELGISASTEPVLHGPTHNPWATGHSPGGSSGGAAAAVSARILPMAHATDGGGSIRIPAANCGLFGLKPTRARNPTGPDLGEGWSGFSCGHAVTRSVRDSAALLDATSGPAPGDPYWAPAAQGRFLDAVGADPGRLRIALSTTAPNGVPVHPDCVRAAEQAAALCEDLGHVVEEAAPAFDMELAIATMRVIWSSNLWVGLNLRYQALGRETDGSDVEAITWLMAQDGREKSATDYARALQIIHKTGRDFAAFFETYDVALTPTMAQPPWPFGTINMMGNDLDAYVDTLFSHMPATAQYNMTGQPAASVPLYWNDAGLPIGVQFAGRFGDEATLFKLSAQLEKARPWAERKPALD